MKYILVLLLSFPLGVLGQLKGKVVRIADGDTFTILVEERQYRIRLHGIDSPEKGQDFSNAAKTYLSDLIMHRIVEVQQKNRDRYGRIVGIAKIDGVNINESLLRQGYAWHFTRYDKNPEWATLEQMARAGRKGLWVQSNPLAPWEFRKNK
jgi:micrococcal nuclease